MTKEQFDKLYLGKAVHCDTEEKANEFLALADSVGYKWESGKRLIEKNAWERYEKETCYYVTNDSLTYSNTNYFKLGVYQLIKYQSQPKLKVGDRVRVKDTPYIVNGKVGVIEKVNPLSPLPYAVKIDGDSWLWILTENELEKTEEPTYKEETIDDIIEEIEYHQKAINLLHNRLKRKAKVGK